MATRFDIRIKKIGTNETMVVTQADLSNYLLTKQWEVVETILVNEPEPQARSMELSVNEPKKKKKSGCSSCGRK